MKKIISSILSLMLFVDCLAVIPPNNVFAADEQKGDFMYNEIGEITSYVSDNGICEIPENTKADFLSGKKAEESKPIKKLIINKGVTLPMLDFLTDLEEVEFKEGVTEIESRLLEDCKSLEKVTLSSTVKKIGDRAFMDCESLKKIEWADGLQSIGEYAFYGAKSLSGDILMPDTVTYLGDSAFAECGKLNKVHLSDNISNIPSDGQGWFAGTKIEEINIPDTLLDNPPILRADEIIFNSDMTVKIYNAVADSNWCFNKYLKGKTDKTIGQYDGFAVVENTVLRYTGTAKNPTVPEGIKTIGDSAFVYCDIDTVSLPKSLEKISDNAFRMTTLKNIVIPQNVKNIGSNAFYYCPLLESVTVEGNPKLGDRAFELTNILTEDTIVFKQNTQALMEQVSDSGMSETYLPTFYELLNQNRERVGLKPVTVPKEVEKQPKETPKPSITPNPTEPTKPTVEPTVTPAPEVLTVEGSEDITIKVNDKTVVFPDAKPFVDNNGRTQVPIRAVSELLNCKVDWQQDISTVVITKDNGDTVKITLNSNVMTINEKPVQMDTAATLKDDRTFIPVRFVAEALGLTVNWKG